MNRPEIEAFKLANGYLIRGEQQSRQRVPPFTTSSSRRAARGGLSLVRVMLEGAPRASECTIREAVLMCLHTSVISQASLDSLLMKALSFTGERQSDLRVLALQTSVFARYIAGIASQS